MTESNVDKLIYQLLERRGITDKDTFFNPPYIDVDTRNPFQIPGVTAAVERLKTAKDENQKIVIYGDYDIDGLTATTLLNDAFTSFGFRLELYTPDRFKEGYGLNNDALSHIKNDLDADVVVTVDCGTVSFDELKHAADIGLDVIVTDHHQPHEDLPVAEAIVNPHRSDNEYPFIEFAGVGVAFKLVQALQTELPGLDPGQEKWLLDLVALGTVCDVVPLVDENRSLVHWGLKVLSQTRRAGLSELMLAARVDPRTVGAEDLGFRLGPRLNASGRLTHAKRSLKLLTTDSRSEATLLATELEQLNSERRTIQREVLDQALEQAADNDQPVLVVSGEDWNEGVIGIVAAKLLETFEKPSFVFSIEGDTAKASARAYGDFSAVEAIRAADEVVVSGGGHVAAGGCTVNTKDIDRFTELVNKYYRSLKIDRDSQRATLKPVADIEIDSYKVLNPQLVERLAELEPYGQANPRPLLALTVASFEQKLVGKQKNHLKLTLIDNNNQRIGGIVFGRDSHVDDLGKVIATINLSNYDPRGVDLIIKDFT